MSLSFLRYGELSENRVTTRNSLLVSPESVTEQKLAYLIVLSEVIKIAKQFINNFFIISQTYLKSWTINFMSNVSDAEHLLLWIYLLLIV